MLFNHSGEDFHGEKRKGGGERRAFRSFSLCLEASHPLLCLSPQRKKNPNEKKKNVSNEKKTVKAGDRVAQLILERIATPQILEVEDLDDTARGAGGYGSTGVKS